MNLGKLAALLQAQWGFARNTPAKQHPYLLYKSNVPVVRNSTNTTGTAGVDDDEEVILWTGSIPASLLQAGTTIWAYGLWRSTASANVKTLIFKVNGGAIGVLSPTTNPMNSMSMVYHANNAINAQKIFNGANSGWEGQGAAIATTHDNTNALPILFSCKWSVPVLAEQIVLESLFIAVYPSVGGL